MMDNVLTGSASSLNLFAIKSLPVSIVLSLQDLVMLPLSVAIHSLILWTSLPALTIVYYSQLHVCLTPLRDCLCGTRMYRI